MATFQVVDEAGKYLGDGTMDLDTHTFKAMLTNTAPTKAGSTVAADITEITAANGYTAAGVALSSVTWTETGAGTGIWEFDCAAFSWTASGGSIGPFRYIVIYDDTPTSPADPLLGYVDYGSSVTLTDGNTFTVTPGANGVFRSTVS